MIASDPPTASRSLRDRAVASATAMSAAHDGVVHEQHAKTAGVWDQHFSGRSRALYPFDLRASTLVEKEAEAEIAVYRVGPRVNLVQRPATDNEACDALCAYLSGTVEWQSWKIRERVKASTAFLEAGFTDFKTSASLRIRRAGSRNSCRRGGRTCGPRHLPTESPLPRL